MEGMSMISPFKISRYLKDGDALKFFGDAQGNVVSGPGFSPSASQTTGYWIIGVSMVLEQTLPLWILARQVQLFSLQAWSRLAVLYYENEWSGLNCYIPGARLLEMHQ